MIKTLITVAVAGAFALPMASALADNIVVAQAGGGDASTSTKQEGANPPGAVSPGAPRSAATGEDRKTGAARHTNPSGSAGTSAKHGRFDSLDKNHDGFVSRDEAKDADELNTRFSELDRNNDGKLSRDEYGAINSSARGATGTGSMSGKGAAPDKGPGAQEPANRALGSAGSGKAEGGGSNSSK